jgi:hypothetical protein
MAAIPELGEAILEELRVIREKLDQLENRAGRSDRTWLTPAEMSQEVGVTPRTLQSYVTSGRLNTATYKKEVHGKTFSYRYHRELVLRELGLR